MAYLVKCGGYIPHTFETLSAVRIYTIRLHLADIKCKPDVRDSRKAIIRDLDNGESYTLSTDIVRDKIIHNEVHNTYIVRLDESGREITRWDVKVPRLGGWV